MCISWIIKRLISLMHGVTMKFIYTTFSETFLILKIIQRNFIINVQRYFLKRPLFFSGFSQLKFSQHIFKTNAQNIALYEITSSGRRIFPCLERDRERETARRTEGRTHWHTGIRNEANSRFSKFFELCGEFIRLRKGTSSNEFFLIWHVKILV